MAAYNLRNKESLDRINLNRNNSDMESESQNSDELSCDMCGSIDIVDTREGYVCKSCGIVLEIQKLEYYRPYEDDLLQHAPLGTTQIGFLRERLQNYNSYKLEKLNKLHSIKSNEKVVLEAAKIEISRIFNCLDLSESFKRLVFKKFQKFRSALNPGTKYRSPEKLVPISIYFTFKIHNVLIKESELLEVSKISKKDFNAFKLQIRNFLPKYAERNRKDYILQRILNIAEHFQLGMEFYYQSKKILYKLWEVIKNTKDEVVAGLVASISLLCSFKEKVSVSSICNELGIKMSTIQCQVKKKIFERFKISGFSTLVKSSSILKKVMQNLGLIETEQIETVPDIIEIKLGNAVQVFNANNDVNYYFYVIRQINRLPILISVKLYNKYLPFYESKSKIIKRNYSKRALAKLYDFEIHKFSTGKGLAPPCLNTPI